MLRISLETSDSDEKPSRERAYFIRARAETPQEKVKMEVEVPYILRQCTRQLKSIKQAIEDLRCEKVDIKKDLFAPILSSGDRSVVPFGGLSNQGSNIIWKYKEGAKSPTVRIQNKEQLDEPSVPEDFPGLV
jgi:hypothetical protein